MVLDWDKDCQREPVCLSFSSPDSDREQTTEDNEKQTFGREEGEGSKNEEKVGHSGVGQERRGRRSGVKKKKRGRRGKSDCQKRGTVKYIATGNRPSHVPTVNVTGPVAFDVRPR